MIGLIPAAGHATRFNGFPKFLLPVPEGNLLGLHCRRMHDAGANRVLIGAGMHNAETISRYRPADTEMYMGGATMAETVLNAREDCGDESVFFGMADTYWKAPDVYGYLSRYFRADVRLAVWKIRDDQRGKLGQVAFDLDQELEDVVDKDSSCDYAWAWGALIWNVKFWEFITPNMPHIGYALMPALKAGLHIEVVKVIGDYWDCGSFESYAQLCCTFSKEKVNA